MVNKKVKITVVNNLDLEHKKRVTAFFEEATVKGFFGILLHDNLISNEEYEGCMKDCRKLYGR